MTEIARKAPVGNEAGLAAAVEQIKAGALSQGLWRVDYDAERDIARIRRADAGPAITYEAPGQPDILVRLDIETGELTGFDLMEAKLRLVRRSEDLYHMATHLESRASKVNPKELVGGLGPLTPIGV